LRCLASASEVWDAHQERGLGAAAGTLEDLGAQIWDSSSRIESGRSLGHGDPQIGISPAWRWRTGRRAPWSSTCSAMRPQCFDRGRALGSSEARIPLLSMHNNRAYYNDWEHQIRMAKLRGTPLERAHIGMDLADPAPDSAAMASRWAGTRKALSTSLRKFLPRAARDQAGQVRQPRLLDTITQKR